ncbi:hypothetical protein HU200_021287 [Digitaria exilis]|uniref:TFIIS N-terminal domain-containing protein n=1 Tax=Digitaria exilis TaxID=1010633 RepID=A0A835F0B3_9POAL|nr:hypothetical protein HU200_021287 [Digitaria exilis]
MAGAGLEQWRELFRGRDIYDVISKAIFIAATDSPKEFRRRRDGIVEQIYTAPSAAATISATLLQGSCGGGSALQVSDKGSKVASCTVAAVPVAPPAAEEPDEKKDEEGVAAADDKHGNNGNGDKTNSFSEIDMDWLETIAEEMDTETQENTEVLRIKEILLSHHEQSTDNLFESLRQLQLMQLNVDQIKNTEIGHAVAALRKHKLHKIRMLVREIIKGWKAVVDDWCAASNATMDDDSNKSLDMSNPLSADQDEGGLATPPMDVGALFLVSQETAIQNVAEFLHGMDDDGITTDVVADMDTGRGGCGSNNKYDVEKPSNTVPSWSNDAPVVEALTVTQGPTLETRNPQNLPARERTPSRNTNPPQKLLNAAGNNWLLRQQGRQSDLPTRQALKQTNIRKTQGQGPQIPRVPRIRIKMKDSVTGYVPSRLSDRTLEKKPCDENQQGTVTVTRNLPTVSAGELPSDQVVLVSLLSFATEIYV